MLIKSHILQFAQRQKSFKTRDVLKSLKNKYSRQYVVKILRELIKENKIVRKGKGNQSVYHYIEVVDSFTKRYQNKKLEEHKVFDEIQQNFLSDKKIVENVHSIFFYAFSEIFNNAIEHSKSKEIDLDVFVVEKKIKFVIRDYGIGVFRNIMKKKKLKSDLESIQELLKGKLTTQPRSHSGEGIFFTSKSGELFILNSYEYQLRIDNSLPDVFIKKLEKPLEGTQVIFEIELSHKGHLNDVFKRYYSDPEEYAFDRTEIKIKLYTLGSIFISRSQARRVLARLEDFKEVILDFEKVPTVGQAFADEVFRVFKNRNPDVKIIPINMNDTVKFMVERVGKI